MVVCGASWGGSWQPGLDSVGWIHLCLACKCLKGGGELWREPLLLRERKHFQSSNCLLQIGLSWVLIKFLLLFLTEEKKNLDNPFRWKNLYLSIFIFNCTLCAHIFPENNANYQLLGIWAFVWHFSEEKNTCKHLTLWRMLNRVMYQERSILSQLCWLKVDWFVNLEGEKMPVQTHPSCSSSRLVVP